MDFLRRRLQSESEIREARVVELSRPCRPSILLPRVRRECKVNVILLSSFRRRIFCGA